MSFRAVRRTFRAVKNFFHAHKGNAHHPHLLRPNAVLAVLSLVIIIELVIISQVFVLFRGMNFMASVLPSVVGSLTNESRVANHVAPLAMNSTLSLAAQAKAEDMAHKGYFSHVSPDGTLPWHWLDEAGYSYEYAGENLAVNFTDSEELLHGWMASPTHRENILKPTYTELGIGMATGTYQGKQTIFVVQFFASPMPVVQLPVKTFATTSSSTAVDLVTVGTATVLGETTQNTQNIAASHGEKIPPRSLWSKFIDMLTASPKTTATEALLALFTFFVGVLAYNLIKISRHPRAPHRVAMLSGAAIAVIAVAFIVLNQHVLFDPLTIPADDQHAAAIRFVLP